MATWKLELLRYPRAALFRFDDRSEVVALVAFLEDRHIRMWDIERRGPLRKDGPGWQEAFTEYLQVRAGP
jgi:hypothetical protein